MVESSSYQKSIWMCILKWIQKKQVSNFHIINANKLIEKNEEEEEKKPTESKQQQPTALNKMPMILIDLCDCCWWLLLITFKNNRSHFFGRRSAAHWNFIRNGKGSSEGNNKLSEWQSCVESELEQNPNICLTTQIEIWNANRTHKHSFSDAKALPMQWVSSVTHLFSKSSQNWATEKKNERFRSILVDLVITIFFGDVIAIVDFLW